LKYTLSEEFLEKYKDKQPNWGVLGFITYKRTYARRVENENRTENWWETIRRVVEGNYNLPVNDPRPHHEIIKEMELTYDLMFNFAFIAPGRGLWISGTDIGMKNGSALVNCWNIACKPICYIEGKAKKVSMPFCFSFDQAMLGGGIGFNVMKQNVNKIPTVKNIVDLTIVCDYDHKDFNMISDIVVTKKPEKYDIYYKCEDSRQGWVEALKQTIDSHWLKKKVIKLVIDISDIRPKGDLINGFGGVASGPKPLAELLKFANNLINNRVTGKLSPVDCSDLINYVGRTVVAGNVRRTAILIFCDADNMEFINMKNYLIPEKLDIPEEREKLTEDQIAYLEVMREFQVSHRWSANISVAIDNNFNNYDQFIDSLATNGEPGIVNLELARRYGRLIDKDKYKEELADPEVDGFNACAEITLASGEPCNLAEVFPYICNKLGVDIKIVLDLATKYAKRVTFANYDWEITRKIIEKNRRIGVSLSGIQDWVMNYFDNYDDLKNTLDKMYNMVKSSDVEYSKILNCNPSIKLTTVKPSGTASLLPGVSPGMHWHYAPYYIRRIRFSDNDNLLNILEKCGYYMEKDLVSPNTMVVEFPVKVELAEHQNFKSAMDITIEEQFKFQSLLQEWWSDNSVSCTISFKSEEKDKIPKLINMYKDKLKSTSLLPYSDHNYKQIPYQPITKEEYKYRKSLIKYKPEDIMKIDNSESTELIDSMECSSGHCPIK